MEEKKIGLLIVDDEEQFLKSISTRLEVRDFNVIAVNRGEKAVEAARQHPIDVALVVPSSKSQTTRCRVLLLNCTFNDGAPSVTDAVGSALGRSGSSGA